MSLLEDIERIRTKNRGRNASFNYEEKNLELLVDDPKFISPEVLRQIRRLGFKLVRIGKINLSELRAYETYFRSKSEEIFDKAFGLINVPIDLDLLKSVSSTENKELVEEISTGRPIREILREEFLKIFFKDKNTSHYALETYKDIHRFKTENYDSHLLTVLTSTDLVSPILVSQSAESKGKLRLAYHPTGRKGKLYGLSGPLGGREKLYSVDINLTPFRQREKRLRDRLFIELTSHEFLGHAIMNLDDHNDLNPGDCLMATKKSDEEYLEICKTKRELYFCDECSKRLP